MMAKDLESKKHGEKVWLGSVSLTKDVGNLGTTRSISSSQGSQLDASKNASKGFEQIVILSKRACRPVASVRMCHQQG